MDALRVQLECADIDHISRTNACSSMAFTNRLLLETMKPLSLECLTSRASISGRLGTTSREHQRRMPRSSTLNLPTSLLPNTSESGANKRQITNSRINYVFSIFFNVSYNPLIISTDLLLYNYNNKVMRAQLEPSIQAILSTGHSYVPYESNTPYNVLLEFRLLQLLCWMLLWYQRQSLDPHVHS